VKKFLVLQIRERERITKLAGSGILKLHTFSWLLLLLLLLLLFFHYGTFVMVSTNLEEAMCQRVMQATRCSQTNLHGYIWHACIHASEFFGTPTKEKILRPSVRPSVRPSILRRDPKCISLFNCPKCVSVKILTRVFCT
jgi:hypothetical protein